MSDTATDMAALLDLLSRFDVAEFDYRDATRHIRVHGGCMTAGHAEATPDAPSARPTAASPARAPDDAILSPGVGRFRAHRGQALPRGVAQGEILGTLSTGLVVTPVVAPADGLLLTICHEDGTGVGYGTPLFHMDNKKRGRP